MACIATMIALHSPLNLAFERQELGSGKIEDGEDVARVKMDGRMVTGARPVQSHLLTLYNIQRSKSALWVVHRWCTSQSSCVTCEQ